MKTRLRCPECAGRIEVSEEQAGRRQTCQCGFLLSVPADLWLCHRPDGTSDTWDLQDVSYFVFPDTDLAKREEFFIFLIRQLPPQTEERLQEFGQNWHRVGSPEDTARHLVVAAESRAKEIVDTRKVRTQNMTYAGVQSLTVQAEIHPYRAEQNPAHALFLSLIPGGAEFPWIRYYVARGEDGACRLELPPGDGLPAHVPTTPQPIAQSEANRVTFPSPPRAPEQNQPTTWTQTLHARSREEMPEEVKQAERRVISDAVAKGTLRTRMIVIGLFVACLALLGAVLVLRPLAGGVRWAVTPWSAVTLIVSIWAAVKVATGHRAIRQVSMSKLAQLSLGWSTYVSTMADGRPFIDTSGLEKSVRRLVRYHGSAKIRAATALAIAALVAAVVYSAGNDPIAIATAPLLTAAILLHVPSRARVLEWAQEQVLHCNAGPHGFEFREGITQW